LNRRVLLVPNAPSLAVLLVTLLLVTGAPGRVRAQAPRGGQVSPTTAQQAAPRDLTGYWVSVVTEDWRWRMVVPVKGDFAIVPLNPEGRNAANVWDPSKDKSVEDQCKPYGAASILRVPGRLHIYWQDGNTLRIDTDSGMQTRLLHFTGAPPATGAPELQGYSVASWDGVPLMRGRAQSEPNPDPDARKGYLKVVTTHMRPGYLRRNGTPYSANATLEEFLDPFSEPNGDNWLVITIVLTDPEYLTQPYVTHATFKKLPDNSGWDPTPCRADEAR
jgi:hypothetical protein